MDKYQREQFELEFSAKQKVPLSEVQACRSGDYYWDEANTITKGINLAWTFWKAAMTCRG